MAAMKKQITEQKSTIDDLSLKIKHLNNESRKYKDEIETLKEKNKSLRADTLQERKRAREREAKYQEQIKDLNSMVEYLDKQLEEKNKELDVARSNTIQSGEGAQAAILKDPSGNTEDKFELPEIQATNRDVSVTEGVYASEGHKKKKQVSSDDRPLWHH